MGGKINFVRPPVRRIRRIEAARVVQVIPVLSVVGDHITEGLEAELVTDGHIEI